MIKNIENNIKKLNLDIQSNIKNHSLQIIKKLFNKCAQTNKIYDKLSGMLKSTKHFIKNHPNLILTRADKGNVTVALDKNEYIKKIESMLQDQETYLNIKNNPINKITNLARGLLTRWKNNKYISAETYKRVFCSDGILPRAYGLLKIHKNNNSYRIIISSIDSPLYQLSKYLHEIINNNIPDTSSHIDNSFQLVRKLNGLVLGDDIDLISLNAVSLSLH